MEARKACARQSTYSGNKVAERRTDGHVLCLSCGTTTVRLVVGWCFSKRALRRPGSVMAQSTSCTDTPALLPTTNYRTQRPMFHYPASGPHCKPQPKPRSAPGHRRKGCGHWNGKDSITPAAFCLRPLLYRDAAVLVAIELPSRYTLSCTCRAAASKERRKAAPSALLLVPHERRRRPHITSATRAPMVKQRCPS